MYIFSYDLLVSLYIKLLGLIMLKHLAMISLYPLLYSIPLCEYEAMYILIFLSIDWIAILNMGLCVRVNSLLIAQSGIPGLCSITY